MSVTATTNSMCNQLIQRYYDMVAPIHKVKFKIRSELNKFETMLARMVFSASNAIDNALLNLETETKGLIPGSDIDSLREIKKFLDGCDFFGGTNAVAAVLGGSLGIYDQIDVYLETIPLPEFKAGTIANAINQLMRGTGLGLPYSNNIEEALRDGERILTCLDAFCPGKVGEAQLILNDLQELYNILRIEDDPNHPNYGKVAYHSIYEAVGLDEGQILNMDRVIDGMWATKADAQQGIGNSVASIKNAIKGGFF
jgi:hypothetical protein